MKRIDQQSLTKAFAEKRVKNVRIVRRDQKSWYFTVDVPGPDKKLETYALFTTRRVQRTWADPRRLFSYLRDQYDVLSGAFQLVEDDYHEVEPT